MKDFINKKDVTINNCIVLLEEAKKILDGVEEFWDHSEAVSDILEDLYFQQDASYFEQAAAKEEKEEE